MLAAAERWGGGADERPYLPRAFSVRARRRRALRVHARGRRPGHRSPRRAARRRRAAGSPARSGNGFAARATAARRCCAAAASAPRRWRSGRTSSRRGRPRPRCSASATARTPPARDAAAPTRASPPTTARVGHHGLVTELLRAELDADARHGLRLRPAGDARGRARAVRGARRAQPQLALESGMACGFGACFGCVVPTAAAATRGCASTARSSTADRRSPRCRRIDRLLRHRAGPSGRQRLGYVRRDRRPPGVRRRLLERLPVRRVRLQDDHARAARRATRRRGCSRPRRG